MKKILLLLFFSFMLVGCGRNQSQNIVNDLQKKFDKSTGYHLTGELEIQNNDEVYHYEVESYYQKEDHYKVILTNHANDHTQIILKNEEGVYVLTPSLNKSFRFQSDWPYHHSQIYLLDSILNDLKEDKNKTFQKEKNSYVFQTKCDYPMNARLVRQKIVFDKDQQLKKVLVYDQDGIETMSMTFKSIQYSPKWKEDIFDLDTIMDTQEVEKEATAVLEDIIYPLFVPDGTKLVGEEKVQKTNGERVIMNYDGEKSFLLVEETADVFQDFTVIPTSGEPYFLMDTLGVMTEHSLSWTTGGIEYYLVSDVMSSDELVEVAQSISGIVSMK